MDILKYTLVASERVNNNYVINECYLDGRIRCSREIHERRDTSDCSGWQRIWIWIFQRLGRQRTISTRYSSGHSRVIRKNTQASAL